MSFIKNGDAEQIITVHSPKSSSEDEETKKKLEAARQQSKNIDKDGNKTELPKNS